MSHLAINKRPVVESVTLTLKPIEALAVLRAVGRTSGHDVSYGTDDHPLVPVTLGDALFRVYTDLKPHHDDLLASAKEQS